MDDPGISLFQCKGLNVEHNENQEETEDLEEQVKRREELQNLLIHALDDFKYEDSTIDSSTNISVASVECMDQAYQDVQTPYEQLKFLCDIRIKEMQSLKNEFDDYRETITKEMEKLNHQITLQEAEKSQVEISLKNTKSLLVEKLDLIAGKDKDIISKGEEIEKLKTIVEQLQYDVQAYNSTIEELQLKLTMNTGPFNVAARVFNAEELHNNHREQIEKLENLLEEYNKKINILEKHKEQFENDLKKTIHDNDEKQKLHDNSMTLLNASIESAQNQCKELLNLVDLLSKENEHYRDRIQKLEASEPILLSNSSRRKSLDYDTLYSHNERLKKMLLDKNVEVCTLKSKVKFYERDMKELIDYRDIRYKSLLVKECGNPEHYEKITVLQNEIKKLELDLTDRDEEISNLTVTNKELENRVENLIIQTRNDLENLSNKYNLPELETMKQELQNAEIKIIELQKKLENSEANTAKLMAQLKEKNDFNILNLHSEKDGKVPDSDNILENNINCSQVEILMIEENKRLLKELQYFKDKLNEFENENNIIKAQLDSHSQLTQQLDEINNEYKNEGSLVNDLLTFKTDIENFLTLYKKKEIQRELIEIKIRSWINQVNLICIALKKWTVSENLLKENLKELTNDLRTSQKEIVNLTEVIEEVNNSKIILEGEKRSLELEVKELQKEFNKKIKEFNKLENEITEFKQEEKNVTIRTLEDASQHLEETKEELIKYQYVLREKCEIIEKLENELKSTKDHLIISQANVKKMEVMISELPNEPAGPKTKENEDKNSSEDECSSKAKLLEYEVSLREELHKEYEDKISRIEKAYKKIFESNQQKLNKFKDQENNYRHQLADILGKYAQIISPIQKENEDLKEHLTKIEVHYNELKKYVDVAKKENNTPIDPQKSIDAWKMWAKTFVQGCLSIEKLNTQSRNVILNSLNQLNSQVYSIDNYYDEKIKQYKKKFKLPKK